MPRARPAEPPLHRVLEPRDDDFIPMAPCVALLLRCLCGPEQLTVAAINPPVFACLISVQRLRPNLVAVSGELLEANRPAQYRPETAVAAFIR